jgi:hypothetical protein
MRSAFLLLALAASPVGAQQLGMPMSQMPGVETLGNGVGGQSGARTIEGIVLPDGAVRRLTSALPGSGVTNTQSIGLEIEKSFYAPVGGRADATMESLMKGAVPKSQAELEASKAVVGETWRATEPQNVRGVTVNGVAISLPSSQSLLPSGLIPGFVSARTKDGGTGVSNLFTGSGIPRAADGP